MSSEEPRVEKPSRSTGCGFAFFGVTFATIGILCGVWALSDWYNSLPAVGTVVDLKNKSTSEGMSWYPIVEYEVEGTRYRIEGRTGYDPPLYKIGENLNVLYRVDNPADGCIDSFMQRWFMPLIFGGAGLAFATIAFGNLRRSQTDYHSLEDRSVG